MRSRIITAALLSATAIVLLAGCATTATPGATANPTSTGTATTPTVAATTDATPPPFTSNPNNTLDIPGTIIGKDGLVLVVDQSFVVTVACNASTSKQISPSDLTTIQGYDSYLNQFFTGAEKAYPNSGIKDQEDAINVFNNLVGMANSVNAAVITPESGAAGKTAAVPSSAQAQLEAICAAKDVHGK